MASNTLNPSETPSLQPSAPTPKLAAPTETATPRTPAAPQAQHPIGMGIPFQLQGIPAPQRTSNSSLSAHAKEFVPRYSRSNTSANSSMSISSSSSFRPSTYLRPEAPPTWAGAFQNPEAHFNNPHVYYTPPSVPTTHSGYSGDDFFPDEFSTLGPKQFGKKRHVEKHFHEQMEEWVKSEMDKRNQGQAESSEEQVKADEEQQKLMEEHYDSFWRIVAED